MDLREWVQSLAPEDLPPGAIRINDFTTVIDSARWLASLQSDARNDRALHIRPETQRYEYLRIRNGALDADLQFLFNLTNGANRW